jgi:hypothetical protein
MYNEYINRRKKVAVKRKSAMKTKSIELQLLGPEPIIVAEKGYEHALNWYNYHYESDDARKWLVDYGKKNLTKQQVSGLRNCPRHTIVTTAGWQARMMLNGNTLSESSMRFFGERVAMMVAAGSKVVQPQRQAPTVSIQDRTKAKAKEIIALCEAEVIDQRASMYDFLVRNEINKTIAEYMREYYLPFYNEVDNSDPEVKEMFGKKLLQEQKYWRSVIDDLDRLILNKKAVRTRKPRTKKAKSAVDVVKQMTYQKDSSQYKVASIDPAHIVGCQQLWVFNTKLRTLARYDAIGPAGIQVSRSSLKGFDPATSMLVKLRKPEDVLPKVLDGGRVSLRKVLDSVKAVQKPASGRINTDTILLRAIK